jgi:hypothetical protein
MLLKRSADKYTHKHFRLYVILVLTAVSLFSSCKNKREERQVERSFYYWRSVLKFNDYEKQQLDSLKVKTLYIKFFDVIWDETKKDAMPVSKLLADKNALGSLQPQGSNNPGFSIIPTVFITNECMQKIDSAQIQNLAQNIHSLIIQLIESYSLNAIAEVQFDCDWTATTKHNYFLLLEKIKALWKNTAIPISATIRLHQIKFLTKTGIPPVDKGLLMCYNMGNLKDPASSNSIIETKELKKYIGDLSNYPLPLDVALPLFDWKVLFRNNQYSGLIRDLSSSAFTNSFTKKSGNRFEILKDTLLQGYELKKGDILKDEQSNYEEIITTANEISSRLKNTRTRVVLYHLDSVLLSKYSTYELESIYNSLR